MQKKTNHEKALLHIAFSLAFSLSSCRFTWACNARIALSSGAKVSALVKSAAASSNCFRAWKTVARR